MPQDPGRQIGPLPKAQRDLNPKVDGCDVAVRGIFDLEAFNVQARDALRVGNDVVLNDPVSLNKDH